MLERELAANAEFVESLALADVERAQVDSIFVQVLDQKKELFAQMRAGEMDRRSMRSAIAEIDTATELKLAEVLTADQLELYRAEMKKRSANRNRGRRGGANPQ